MERPKYDDEFKKRDCFARHVCQYMYQFPPDFRLILSSDAPDNECGTSDSIMIRFNHIEFNPDHIVSFGIRALFRLEGSAYLLRCGMPYYLPVHVVLEAVVAGVSDEASSADTEREERLTGGVRPHLQTWRTWTERCIVLLAIYGCFSHQREHLIC